MAGSLNDNVLRALADGFDRSGNINYLFCPLLSAAMAGRDDHAVRLIMETALKNNVPVQTINEIIL